MVADGHVVTTSKLFFSQGLKSQTSRDAECGMGWDESGVGKGRLPHHVVV